jgi:hypothetical protein
MLDIKYTCIPSPLCQDVINLTASLPIRRGPNVFINVYMQNHCALGVDYSNTTTTTIFMSTTMKFPFSKLVAFVSIKG